MADYSDLMTATQAVMDPNTPGIDLMEIADAQPTLWQQVAAHPNAFGDLLAWLAENGDQTVRRQVAARQGGSAQQAAAPVSQLRPVAESARRQNKLAIVLLSFLVLALGGALVAATAVLLPRQSAMSSFNTAQVSLQQSQSDLSTEIGYASGTAQADRTQIADPTTIDSLRQAITDAQEMGGPVPTMGFWASTIRSQASDMQDAAAADRSAVTKLKAAVQAVQASQVTWAQTTLTAAITAANATLSNDTATGGAAEISALQSQIQSATATLSGFEKADPSTAGATAESAVQALQTAEHALTGSLCHGLTLPPGIDQVVCSNMPAGAVRVQPVYMVMADYGTPGYGPAMFVTPSGNIGCWQGGDSSTLLCEAQQKTWVVPSSLHVTCMTTAPTGGCLGVMGLQSGQVAEVAQPDGSVWDYARGENDSVQTLPYGQVANMGQIACSCTPQGVTCWDTTTHHGFMIDKSAFAHW